MESIACKFRCSDEKGCRSSINDCVSLARWAKEPSCNSCWELLDISVEITYTAMVRAAGTRRDVLNVSSRSDLMTSLLDMTGGGGGGAADGDIAALMDDSSDF